VYVGAPAAPPPQQPIRILNRGPVCPLSSTHGQQQPTAMLKKVKEEEGEQEQYAGW
jgi:hypothetical protein